MQDYTQFEVGSLVSLATYHHGDGVQKPTKIGKIENDKYYLEGHPQTPFFLRYLFAVLISKDVLAQFNFTSIKQENESIEISTKKFIAGGNFNTNGKTGAITIDTTSAMSVVTVELIGKTEIHHWHWLHELQNGMRAIYDTDILI